MSYVLDALKKADAERERGSVPGLHAQPLSGLPPAAERPRAATPWAWMLAGAGFVALVAAGWLTLGRGAASGSAAPQPAAVVVPHAVAAMTPIAAAPTPPPPSSAPAVQAPGDMVALHAAPPEPRSLPRPAESQRVAPSQPKALDRATQVVATASSPLGGSAGSSAEARILALGELPEDVRRALPPLNVGSSMYSDNPASRFIMINGQIYHESDKLAADVTLEQIRLKLAVLRYKDLRFRLMY